MKKYIVDLHLSKIGPTLSAAFNAFGIVIGGEQFYEQIEAFEAEFKKSPYWLASRLEVLRGGSAEDLSVEWMSYANSMNLFSY